MFNQLLFRTLEESKLYMVEELRRARESDVTAQPDSMEIWRLCLKLQDLNELRETAKKVSVKISGNKQEVCDAIVAKLAVYEDMYKTMSRNELKEVCQSRGIKGCSTLAKERLIDRLIRSHFEMKKITKLVEDEIPTAIAIKVNEVPVEAKAPEPKFAKGVKSDVETKGNAETEPKKKAAIPKKVKTDVWNTYIGADINKHRCLCCKKTLISNTEFDVGHVVSESIGGTLEIGNLRPICAACNHSMGTRNMVDFVKMFGYYIG